MFEISQGTWVYWQNKPKEKGIETLPANEIQFNSSDYVFSPDEKVIVFRFNSRKGRIIGVKEKNSSVFQVIGFDVDFSAYKH